MFPSIAALAYLGAFIKFMTAIEFGGFLHWIGASLFLVLAISMTVVAYIYRDTTIETTNAPSQ